MGINAHFQAMLSYVRDHSSFKWLMVFLSLFVLWGLLGLLQSPGFTLDESAIVDPAIHFAVKGTLACPSFGPGFHHNDAFLYQTPLHYVSLGWIFRTFGAGMLQGRLFSLFLSLIVLILVYAAMKPFGSHAGIIAVVLLACDPRFCYRAREMRYDWLALIGIIAAFILLSKAGDQKTYKFFRYALAGILVGMAVNSHALYLLYSLAFGFLIVLPFDEHSSFKQRVFRLLFFGMGVAVSLLPFAYYVWNHWEAFTDQFIFLAGYHQQHELNPAHIAAREAAKYIQYYRYTPLLLLLYAGSLSTGIFLWRRLHRAKEPSLNPLQYRHFRQVLVIGILMPVLLACTSGGHSWHHLMIAPFWAMLASIAFTLHSMMKGRLIHNFLVPMLLLLGIFNGLLASWGLRTYLAMEDWGTHDVSAISAQVKKYVPPGSYVYGDYHLVFLAWEENWRFVQELYLVRRDEELLSREPFDFLIYADGTKGPAGADMNSYERIAEIRLPSSPIGLPKLNPANKPLRLRIYKRI